MNSRTVYQLKGPTKSFLIDQTLPLFVYFHSFLMTNLTINDKSVDGVLGNRTQGGRMVGADESSELWRHSPNKELGIDQR